MATIQHGGLALHAQHLGDVSAPPVVMAHGLLIGSLAGWYFTAGPALARTHRVTMYDLRGHGRSGRPATGYDVATMVGDLRAVVDAVASDETPVDLVGHSYGALVALGFARAYPERVRRLVLVEAPLPPSRFAELTGFMESSPQAMLDALPEGLRGLVVGGGRRARRLLEGLRALAFETSLLADLRAEPDVPDRELAALEMPCLCLYGADSACLGAGERLAGALPGGRLEVLPGGHYLPLEQPDAVTEALGRFLGGPEAANG